MNDPHASNDLAARRGSVRAALSALSALASLSLDLASLHEWAAFSLPSASTDPSEKAAGAAEKAADATDATLEAMGHALAAALAAYPCAPEVDATVRVLCGADFATLAARAANDGAGHVASVVAPALAALDALAPLPAA